MLNNRLELRSYPAENRSHVHDFGQLLVPISGSMELEVGHYTGVVTDDIGVYITPNEHHCFAGSPKNLFLVIDVTSTNSICEGQSKSNTFNLTMSTKKLVQFIHHYLLHHERDLLTDALINQLLIQVTALSFSHEPDPVVIKAKHWIDVHFQKPVNVNSVAKHCHLSASQLQRRFKQVLGCSLAEYWRMKKLHHAKRALSQKNCSIEAVAFEVGYENLSAFSRRFNKVFGESPSQWRTKALTAKRMREMDN